MRYTITVEFSANDIEQAESLQGLIAHMAPFVVDNVDVLDPAEDNR